MADGQDKSKRKHTRTLSSISEASYPCGQNLKPRESTYVKKSKIIQRNMVSSAIVRDSKI